MCLFAFCQGLACVCLSVSFGRFLAQTACSGGRAGGRRESCGGGPSWCASSNRRAVVWPDNMGCWRGSGGRNALSVGVCGAVGGASRALAGESRRGRRLALEIGRTHKQPHTMLANGHKERQSRVVVAVRSCSRRKRPSLVGRRSSAVFRAGPARGAASVWPGLAFVRERRPTCAGRAPFGRPASRRALAPGATVPSGWPKRAAFGKARRRNGSSPCALARRLLRAADSLGARFGPARPGRLKGQKCAEPPV